MNAGDVTVRLRADIANLQAGLAKGTSLVKKFETATMAPLRALDRSLKGLFNMRNLATAGAVAAIVKIGSAAEEAENLFDVSFQGMSGSVRAWSEDLAEQLRVSGTGLRQTAANFQLFLTGMGEFTW